MEPSAKIDIGTPIYLQNLLETRLLIQANSGGGKSVLARVIIEQVSGKVPFIVFDIDGEYYTLKEKSGDIIVIGGQYADVPINTATAKLLPPEIISNRLSVIIDLSDLKMQERIMYVKHFLERMMELPKDYWTSYLIFLEEAHKLCGEQDKQESAAAVKDLMSRGRKKGYCGILLTQRISKLHKDAAAECNNKFIGRTFLDIDVERCIRELGAVNRIEQGKILRELKAGEFWAFGTAIQPHYPHSVTVKHPQTKIVKVGSIENIKPQKPTDKILAVLAKLNAPAKPAETKTAVSSLSKVDANQIDRLKKEVEDLQQQKAKFISTINDQSKQLQGYYQLIQHYAKNERTIREALNTEPTIKYEDLPKPITTHSRSASSKSAEPISKKFTEHKVKQNSTGTTTTIPVGERKILIACAQFPNGVRRDQLTVLTGYKRSSRDAYIQRLREKKFLELNGDKLTSTDAGVAALGDDYEPLPTGRELQEYWLAKLPQGEAVILQLLIAAYPEAVKRDEITNRIGYQRSTRDAYIQRMNAKELINSSDRGEVKAADNLFKQPIQ